MTAMTITNAKKEITSKIADRLRHSLKGSAVHLPLGSADIDAWSNAILECLTSDHDSVDALIVILHHNTGSIKGPDQDPWLTTEVAALKMGFSRPYVIALIDSGEFGTGATKTPKGHRRVRASAVEKWLRDHEVSPERIAQAETTDDMEEFFDVSELSPADSTQLDKRVRRGRHESQSHRPAPKRT